MTRTMTCTFSKVRSGMTRMTPLFAASDGPYDKLIVLIDVAGWHHELSAAAARALLRNFAGAH